MGGVGLQTNDVPADQRVEHNAIPAYIPVRRRPTFRQMRANAAISRYRADREPEEEE